MNAYELIVKAQAATSVDEIDDLLCLATLVASKQLGKKSTLKDASEYHKQIVHLDCLECRIHNRCVRWLNE
jgi:hypothetical protein